MIKGTKEELMDKLIKRVGLENEYVIWFCKLCEEEEFLSEQALDFAYNTVLEHTSIE